MWFSFDGDSFEIHETPEAAKAIADAALKDYEDSACDGWDEAAYQVCWGRVIQRATVVNERDRRPEDAVDPDIDTIHEIELFGDIEHRCNICGGLVVFDGTPPAIKSMK